MLAAWLQPAVQVVPRHEPRGRALQSLDLRQDRERLFEHEVAHRFLSVLVEQGRKKGLFLAEVHADRGLGIDEELSSERRGRR